MTPPTPLEMARRITDSLEQAKGDLTSMWEVMEVLLPSALSDSRALVQLLEKDGAVEGVEVFTNAELLENARAHKAVGRSYFLMVNTYRQTVADVSVRLLPRPEVEEQVDL